MYLRYWLCWKVWRGRLLCCLVFQMREMSCYIQTCPAIFRNRKLGHPNWPSRTTEISRAEHDTWIPIDSDGRWSECTIILAGRGRSRSSTVLMGVDGSIYKNFGCFCARWWLSIQKSQIALIILVGINLAQHSDERWVGAKISLNGRWAAQQFWRALIMTGSDFFGLIWLEYWEVNTRNSCLTWGYEFGNSQRWLALISYSAMIQCKKTDYY